MASNISNGISQKLIQNMPLRMVFANYYQKLKITLRFMTSELVSIIFLDPFTIRSCDTALCGTYITVHILNTKSALMLLNRNGWLAPCKVLLVDYNMVYIDL